MNVSCEILSSPLTFIFWNISLSYTLHPSPLLSLTWIQIHVLNTRSLIHICLVQYLLVICCKLIIFEEKGTGEDDLFDKYAPLFCFALTTMLWTVWTIKTVIIISIFIRTPQVYNARKVNSSCVSSAYILNPVLSGRNL